MTPESYARVVAEVRRLADLIEALRYPQTPVERRRLTTAISALMRYTRVVWLRHSGLPAREFGDFRLELPKAERL
jgi:hypothetical protein